MAETVTINVKELDKILRLFKSEPPKVKVGILGSKNGRKGGKDTNAAIGAKHEFGADGMPIRSFLRIPISEHLEDYLENAGAFKEDAIKQAAKEGSLVGWMKMVGVLAEKIVSDAFASRGFGKWPSWKIPGYTNRTGNILVDTQQLRNSITSKVE